MYFFCVFIFTFTYVFYSIQNNFEDKCYTKSVSMHFELNKVKRLY
jgi:hypothetical protein